jgi:hypothetical protein
MYRKNTASQYIYFVLVKATDGTALTGATVTAYRALDNGSQASATGTTTELANGQYRFNLSQADTNADYGSYLFTAATAVPVEKTVVFTAANPTDATSFGLSRLDAAITSRLAPTVAGRTLDVSTGGEAGIDFANIGSPTTVVNLSGTTIKTATDVETDTQDIQSRLPTALVGGRINASVSDIVANTETAFAITLSSAVWDRPKNQHNTAGSFGFLVNSIDSRLPSTLVSGRIDASVGAMAANTLTASALASDAVAEIADQVWDETTTGHNALGSFGYVVQEGASEAVIASGQTTQIMDVTDKLDTALEADGLVWRYTANALEQAPGGGGSGDASQATLLLVKAKTDLITVGTIYTTVDRVYGSTITTYLNESTSINVPLQEDTTSKTLRFVVENADALDVLVIENANITRTSSQFTVTITTAVTATLGQYKWSLREITGGINRVVQLGVLQVVGAANKDA